MNKINALRLHAAPLGETRDIFPIFGADLWSMMLHLLWCMALHRSSLSTWLLWWDLAHTDVTGACQT